MKWNCKLRLRVNGDQPVTVMIQVVHTLSSTIALDEWINSKLFKTGPSARQRLTASTVSSPCVLNKRNIQACILNVYIRTYHLDLELKSF